MGSSVSEEEGEDEEEEEEDEEHSNPSNLYCKDLDAAGVVVIVSINLYWSLQSP